MICLSGSIRLNILCSHLSSLCVCLTLKMTDRVSCFHSREVAEGTVIHFDRDMRRRDGDRWRWGWRSKGFDRKEEREQEAIGERSGVSDERWRLVLGDRLYITRNPKPCHRQEVDQKQTERKVEREGTPLKGQDEENTWWCFSVLGRPNPKCDRTRVNRRKQREWHQIHQKTQVWLGDRAAELYGWMNQGCYRY